MAYPSWMRQWKGEEMGGSATTKDKTESMIEARSERASTAFEMRPEVNTQFHFPVDAIQELMKTQAHEWRYGVASR